MKFRLTLDEETRELLLGLSKSTTLPHRVVLRAKMILASAEGLTNTDTGRRVGASPQAVGKWRRRFLENGLSGLDDELRPGRPRSYDDDKVAGLLNRALQEKPQGSTHWSARTLGKAEWGFPQHGAALAPAVRSQAASDEDMQAVQRPFLDRESARYRWTILESAITRSCWAWTRSRRCRPWTARNGPCRWAWAMSKGSRTTTFATARPRSSPRWTSPPARCWRAARHATGTRNS